MLVLTGQKQKDIAAGAELLSRLVSLDERAWSEFYRFAAPQLGKFAAHRGVHDAEDVVQDAMVRFFTAIREERLRMDTIGDAIAYLNTLVRNLAIDRFRRDKVRCRDMTVTLDEFMVPAPPLAPMIVEAKEALAIRERSRRLALASWAGNARAKSVYVACVLEGRSVGEVADELGIPPNTVSQIKRRGIQKARQLEEAAA